MASLPLGLDIQAIGLEKKSLSPSLGRRGVEQSWGTFRPESMTLILFQVQSEKRLFSLTWFYTGRAGNVARDLRNTSLS